jgi:hypothetical protein
MVVTGTERRQTADATSLALVNAPQGIKRAWKSQASFGGHEASCCCRPCLRAVERKPAAVRSQAASMRSATEPPGLNVPALRKIDHEIARALRGTGSKSWCQGGVALVCERQFHMIQLLLVRLPPPLQGEEG